MNRGRLRGVVDRAEANAHHLGGGMFVGRPYSSVNGPVSRPGRGARYGCPSTRPAWPSRTDVQHHARAVERCSAQLALDRQHGVRASRPRASARALAPTLSARARTERCPLVPSTYRRWVELTARGRPLRRESKSRTPGRRAAGKARSTAGGARLPKRGVSCRVVIML